MNIDQPVTNKELREGFDALAQEMGIELKTEQEKQEFYAKVLKVTWELA